MSSNRARGARPAAAVLTSALLVLGLSGVAAGSAAAAPPAKAPPPGHADTPKVGDAPNVQPVPLPAPPSLPGVPPLRPVPDGTVPEPGGLRFPAVPLVPLPGPAHVQVVADGLTIPWDIGFLPNGSALVNERAGRFELITDPTRPGSAVIDVDADFSDLVSVGDGGMSGMAISPDFARTRRFVTCLDHTRDGQPVDVRLVTWRLSEDGTTASPVAGPLTRPVMDVLPGGLEGVTDRLPGLGSNAAADRTGAVYAGAPLADSGLHSDCRPRFGPDGNLWVATGDAGRAGTAQNLHSLGGKVLRIDPNTGGPAAGNPFIDSPDPKTRLVYTYGHRNPQGVAFQPGTGWVYTAGHGPSADDEVNVLVPGGNYGWDPSFGGKRRGFVGPSPKNVPMTNLDLYPDAVQAVWSSGVPTVAASDDEFLTDPGWGDRQGMLAVATLKGSALLLMKLAPSGTITNVTSLPQLDGTYGRLRTVETGPDGALYVTTSNGYDDKILRVEPF